MEHAPHASESQPLTSHSDTARNNQSGYHAPHNYYNHPPHPSSANPQASVSYAYNPQTANHATAGQYPIIELPDISQVNMKEGVPLALFIQDGAVCFRPYTPPPSASPCGWFVNIDRVLRENAHPWYRLFLYVSTSFLVINTVVSLILAIIHGRSSLWLTFALTILGALIGVYELFAVYGRTTIRGNFHLFILASYIGFYVLTLICLSTDRNELVRSRSVPYYDHYYGQTYYGYQDYNPGRAVSETVYLILYSINLVFQVWMILMDQSFIQKRQTDKKE